MSGDSESPKVTLRNASLAFAIAMAQTHIMGEILALKQRVRNLMLAYHDIQQSAPDSADLQSIAEEIIELWGDVLRRNPDDYQTYLEMARYFKQLGLEDKAGPVLAVGISLVRKAADQEEPDPVACEIYANYLTGRTVDRQENIKKAIIYFDRATVYSGEDAPMNRLFKLAKCYEEIGNLELAGLYYERANEAHEKIVAGKAHPPSILGLMSLAYKNQNFDDVLKYADIGIEQAWADPVNALKEDNFAHFWRIKGRMLIELGRLDEAFENYENAIGAFPDDGEFYRDAGAMATALGLKDDAEEFYTAATRVNPHDLLSYFHLANILMEQGRNAQALHVLDQAKTVEGKYIEAGKMERPRYALAILQGHVASLLELHHDALEYAQNAMELIDIEEGEIRAMDGTDEQRAQALKDLETVREKPRFTITNSLKEIYYNNETPMGSDGLPIIWKDDDECGGMEFTPV